MRINNTGEMRDQSRNFARALAPGIAIVFLVGSLGAAISPSLTQSNQRLPDGNALFFKNCASCHGKNGRATTFKGRVKRARNLTDPNWQETISDEHLYQSILRGKGKMPAFEKKLTENEMAALVTYVRMLKR